MKAGRSARLLDIKTRSPWVSGSARICRWLATTQQASLPSLPEACGRGFAFSFAANFCLTLAVMAYHRGKPLGEK